MDLVVRRSSITKLYPALFDALVMSPEQNYATIIHDAIEDTDSDAIINVMCSLSNNEMKKLTQVYPTSKALQFNSNKVHLRSLL